MTDAVTVSCARCGGIAATFSLVPPEGAARQYGLQRVGFMGQVTRFGDIDTLQRLFDMIRTGDFANARPGDADFVAFHCWTCHHSYCERCWRIGPPEFDDGFYDYTQGVCPEGHEQIVDD